MNKQFRLIIVFFVMMLSAPGYAASCIATRAAIDMGSGSTKIQVAEVDTCHQQIVRVLFEDQRPLGFNDDLGRSADNTISEQMQQQGIKSLREMIAKARSWHPQRISGVATAAFRSASNGQQVVSRFNQQLGIQLAVISQEQEARLGFLSAKASLHEQVRSDEQLLVWDIGGGSMQMTAFRQLAGQQVSDIYQGKLASVTLRDYIVSVLKNQPLTATATPNPIAPFFDQTLRYVRFYARTHVSPEIKQDIKTRRVIGIGGVHGYSILGQLPQKQNGYTLSELAALAKRQSLKGDSELSGEYRTTDVSNLLLVLGYMQALDIDRVTVVKASLLQGVLVSDSAG